MTSRSRLTLVISAPIAHAVAHRPQSVASADRVVVLEGGAITQDLRVSTACAGSRPRATGG